jgi:hypothetical protein
MCGRTWDRPSASLTGVTGGKASRTRRQPSAGLSLSQLLQLPRRLRTEQIHRLPRLTEHLEQHLGRFLEQLEPVTQIGGMAGFSAAS